MAGPVDFGSNAVALGVQTPNSFQTIGNMMNLAQGAQNLKRSQLDYKQGQQALDTSKQEFIKGNIELQKADQANKERIMLQQFMSDPNNFQTDGRIDLNKVNKAIPTIAPLTGAETINRLSTMATAQTEFAQAKSNLTQQQRGVIGGAIGALARRGEQDPKAYIEAIEGLRPFYADDPNFGKLVDNYKIPLSMAQPGPGVLKTAMTAAQAYLTPAEQQSALSPKARLQETGGNLMEVIETPSIGGNPPSVETTGRGVPLTLPPTAERFNPQTNAYEYVGRSGAGGNVQSRPSLGQAETAAGISTGVTGDWNTVQASAKNAAQDIGVLQEIKKYAPGAVTGVEADRRSYLAGIAGILGMDVEQMQKTDTDLLAKNSNMLALAGGDTNLAKTMAETVNPNMKMTPQAITKAANQVIGQRQLALARQQFLLPYINNPQQYNEMSAKFNSIADPRILQLPSLSTQEQIEMKKAMSPSERKTFGEKIREMQRMGVLK